MRFVNFNFLIQIILPLVLLVCSCRETRNSDISFPERGIVQPRSFTAVLFTDSLVTASGKITTPSTTTSSFRSTEKLQSTHANPNWHPLPKELIEIIIPEGSVRRLSFEPSCINSHLNYQVSEVGDSLLTGRLMSVEGQSMAVGLGKTNIASSPRFKDLSNNNIQYLDVEQGMASSYVYSMIEDRQGSLWFGNRFGVSKYDGVEFIHYAQKEGFTTTRCLVEDNDGSIWIGTWGQGLIHYDGSNFIKYLDIDNLIDVYAIAEDSHANLWLGTISGLVKFDGYNFFHFGEKEGFLDVVVNAVFEDSKGILWLGTEEGLAKFDGSKFLLFDDESGLSNNSVLSILEGENGDLWLGTELGGVNKFDGQTFVHYTTKEGLSNNVVRSIIEDNAGNMWFNTDGGGANLFNGEGFIHYGLKEGLYVDIYASMKDSNGNVWFGTNGGGVSRYAPNSFQHYEESNGLVNSYVYAMVEDKKGTILFGTDHGISTFDGQYLRDLLTEDLAIEAIHVDKEHNVWIGIDGYEVYKFDGSSYRRFDNFDEYGIELIRTITGDHEGNVWFGTDGGGVIKFDGTKFTQFTKEDGLESNSVAAILEDTKGAMWFGTGRGLSKYDGQRFSNYSVNRDFHFGAVSSLAEDKLGNLWLGSSENGVCRFDGKSFSLYTEREGLTNNIVKGVLVDLNDNIWVITENGLNQFILQKNDSLNVKPKSDILAYKIMNYRSGDGLKSLDFFMRTMLLDRHNRLWLGGGKCLSMIDLNSHESSSNVPRSYIRDIEINEAFINFKETALSDEHDGIKNSGVLAFSNLPKDLQLDYSKNHLTFHYSAIDWAAPHDLQYSYILDGFNDSWSAVTKETTADYRNVPAGTFTFKVRSKGKNQLWSEEASIIFEIQPPWYQTTWTRSFFIVLGLTLIILIFLIRERNVRLVRKRLEQMVAEKTVMLQSEKMEVINQLAQKEILVQEVHHRVKNNLTFLKSLLFLRANASEDEDVKLILDECQSRIHSMALVHQNLYDVADVSQVDFKLFLEQLFFELENMFNIDRNEIEVKIETYDLKVEMRLSVFLGLILNELITNSYKYAFLDSPIGTISIDFLKHNGDYILSYSDSGQGLFSGFDIEKSTSFGFKLIQILLRQMDGKMDYENEDWSTFKITIPT